MDRVASLLEQYPGPINLVRSRGAVIYQLAIAIFIFGSATYYAIQPDRHGIVAWLAVVFCTLCLTGIAAVLVRGRFELVLDTDGFSIVEGRRCRNFKWAEVDNFAVVGDELMFFRNRVGFDPANTVVDETDGFQSRTFHLPESYGLTNAGCVRLLSLWQERALRGG